MELHGIKKDEFRYYKYKEENSLKAYNKFLNEQKMTGCPIQGKHYPDWIYTIQTYNNKDFYLGYIIPPKKQILIKKDPTIKTEKQILLDEAELLLTINVLKKILTNKKENTDDKKYEKRLQKLKKQRKRGNRAYYPSIFENKIKRI